MGVVELAATGAMGRGDGVNDGEHTSLFYCYSSVLYAGSVFLYVVDCDVISIFISCY